MEAIDRRLRSETILRAEGVPFLAALPVIETTAEALKRSKEEVALRALCLPLVAAKGKGLEEELVKRVLKSYELRPHLTPKELNAFGLMPDPSFFTFARLSLLPSVGCLDDAIRHEAKLSSDLLTHGAQKCPV